MKKFHFKLVCLLLMAQLMMPSYKALAQTSFTYPRTTSIPDIATLIANIIQLLFTLIGVGAVISLIYSGFLMITGDHEKGKKGIQYSIMGIVIAVISFLLVRFVVFTLGGQGINV